MENLLYIFYFLPAIVCLLWVITFLVAEKTTRQNILLCVISVGILYFTTYALYAVPQPDYSLVAILESYSLPSGVIAMELLTIYLILLITRGEIKSYYLMLVIPGLLFTSSLVTLFCSIGYEDVGHFFSFYSNVPDNWTTPYDTQLFRVFYFIEYYTSISLGVLNCAVNIGLCIYLLYKDGYRIGGILEFLLQKKRATPSRIIAFSVIVFCILTSTCSINFYNVMDNPSLHVAYSLAWAIDIHIICFAEYHSNLKVFSYNNLRKAQMYDSIVERKEKEEQERIGAEKTRVDTIMQREGNRSPLVEQRRRQLSVSFQKLMEEDKIFLRDDISVDDVVKELGIGRTVLSNFINISYGTNFRGVINDYRIKYAKEYMLQHPNATQETVALACGFKDAVSYTHKFKNITGLSPVAWLTSQESNA